MIKNDLSITKNKKNKSVLDFAYKNMLYNIQTNSNDFILDRWIIYDQITTELVRLGLVNEFNMIKYRLTDNEDACEVFMDVLSRVDRDHALDFLYRQLNVYVDEDLYAKFTD